MNEAKWSNVKWKKKWRITSSYETNRFSKECLAETYERILPKKKYKLSLQTQNENSIKVDMNLNMSKQGK